jgi:hypothetical protein
MVFRLVISLKESRAIAVVLADSSVLDDPERSAQIIGTERDA